MQVFVVRDQCECIFITSTSLGEDYTSVEWQQTFLKRIMMSPATERKEIKWKSFTSVFCEQNTHSLRRVFDNLVAKRKGDTAMKSVIEQVLLNWDVAKKR
jgi:hypothetical protein